MACSDVMPFPNASLKPVLKKECKSPQKPVAKKQTKDVRHTVLRLCPYDLMKHELLFRIAYREKKIVSFD